jgi:hypothetical protein
MHLIALPHPQPFAPGVEVRLRRPLDERIFQIAIDENTEQQIGERNLIAFEIVAAGEPLLENLKDGR